MSDDFDPTARIPIEALGENVLQAIGLLMASAASVDIALTFQIIRTITNDAQARLNAFPLVFGAEVGVKLGVLRTFLVHRVKDKENLEITLDRIQKCFDKRNLFAHGLPMEGGKYGDVGVREMRFTGETKALPAARYFSCDQILSYARELQFRALQLDTELTKLGITPYKKLESSELSSRPVSGPAPRAK